MSALSGTVLGLLAVLESLAEFIGAHGSIPRLFADATSEAGPHGSAAGVQFAMVVGLLCVCTALPLVFLRPLAAGVTVTAASLGSLLIFETLTLAGFAAQLVAQYRLGRSGSLLPAGLLGTPFLVLALAGPDDTDYRVRVVLVAALAPWPPSSGSSPVPTNRTGSTAPSARSWTAPSGRTPHAESASASSGNCTTSSATTSP